MYDLVYQSKDADSYNFTTGRGGSFGCAYSAWSNGVMHLSRGTDDIVVVIADGVAMTSTTLKRAR